MEMVGYKVFSVFHSGLFYFPESQLTLEEYRTDEGDKFWYEVYRIGPHEGEWMVYYGERLLGYSYIRFAHNREDALAIARNWRSRWEV